MGCARVSARSMTALDEDHPDQRSAERELTERKERVEQLRIRALSPDERDRFVERWRSAQAQFVDDPAGATRVADALIGEIMQARGYPVGDFEQRAADVSVDHPRCRGALSSRPRDRAAHRPWPG